MKKYLLILTCLLGGFTAANAQEDPAGDEAQKQQKIEALYVAYITDQLKLTPDEAQKFWPVHSQFSNELKTVGKAELPVLKRDEAVLNIKKKYQENFNRILGPNRCERFFRMDGEFRRKLLERIRKQRQMQNPRPRVRRGV